MTEGRIRLHGRERVVDYIRAALVRDGVPERPLPIVLLVGPRGSGGSALVDTMWAEFTDDCLSVRLDLRAAQGVEDIVLAATRGLGRRIRGIREIEFPRTAMLLKALSWIDTGGGRAAFETYLRANPQDARAQSALDDWGVRAAPLLSPELRGLLDVLTGLLTALHHAIGRHRNDRALRWLADRGDGGREYESLWELYRQHHGQEGPAGTPRVVARTLCAALLADLRTDFNEGRLRMQRPRNCLLLLDNAGGRTADLFLELLADCRRESAADDQGPDPAVVVAVQRGRIRPEAAWLLDPTDERLDFGVRHPLAPGGAGHPVWWYPVALADLNGEQALALCTSSVLGRHTRDADFLYELTGGHPESTDRLGWLLARFGRTPPRDPRLPPAELPEPFDPRRLLAEQLSADRTLPEHWPPPGRADTVEDYLLKRALADHLTAGADGTVAPDDNATLNAMAALAATPGLRRGACNSALHYLGWSGVDADSAQLRLTASMWLDETPEGDALRLHPLIALLLRRWLARRPETWKAVHTGYATHYSTRAHAPLRHHHTLAQVEQGRREPLTAVVGYLDEEYTNSTSSREWLRVLDQVTAAPNRLTTPLDPRTFVASLAGPAEARNRRRAITRLTVARWLHGDRSFDPAHQLAQTVAAEYEHLAEITEDNELLYQQAGKYRRVENDWKD